MTFGIFGPNGSGSSASVALQSSLENRLRVLMVSSGSPLFALTWKRKVMPSGRRFLQQRALVRHIRGHGSTLWPGAWGTPCSTSYGGTPEKDIERKRKAGMGAFPKVTQLDNQALLVSAWPTPITNDSTGSEYAYSNGNHKRRVLKLPGAAKACGWGTPTARDHKDGKAARVPIKGLLGREVWMVSGKNVTGSPAPMEDRGRLNPEHSRWLMGFPTEWGSCAPMGMPSSRK